MSGNFPSSLHEKYFSLVVKEISEFLISIAIKYNQFTLYIGGGSPSSVNPSFIKNAVKRILELLPVKQVEISIEINPCDINNQLIAVLHDSGINRISLGIQSFNDEVLELLGRRHTREGGMKAFHELRESGFDNINIDLMHGIPGFNIDRWKDDLDSVMKLNPDHISLYALSFEEGTPFHSEGLSRRLNNDLTAEEYHLAVSFLRDAGYNRYEISNFSKAEKECIHNVNYWKMGDYAGFGPSAASYIDGVYSEKEINIMSYIDLIERGESTISATIRYNREDQFKNALIMGMRLESGLETSNINSRFGVDVAEIARKQWNHYIDGRHIIMDDNSVRFGDDGMYVSNSLLSMII